MPALESRTIHLAPAVRVRDVRCTACRGRHQGAEECDPQPALVFPYRGAFIRRLGARAAVADLNQVLFFNAAEGYRIDHPLDGGDACLSFEFAAEWLEGLRDRCITLAGGVARFSEPQRAVTPRAQLLLATIRSTATLEPLVLEHLAAQLLREVTAMGFRHAGRRSAARRRLVERAKLLLQAQPARRWSLGELASALTTSPVYLTQTFSSLQGMPLYRYQTRLRLAHALESLRDCEDLAALALDLGFYSHSQFTAAFTRTYGMAPSEYRRANRRNVVSASRTTG